MARGSKKLDELKQRAKNAARRARDKRENRMRMAATIGTGFLSGKLEQSGYIERLPRLGPLPPMATAGALAAVGSMYAGGKMGTILEGVGTGLLTVAGYQFGKGAEVSGYGVAGMGQDGMYLPPGIAGDLDFENDEEEDEIAGEEEDALAELNEAMAVTAL